MDYNYPPGFVPFLGAAPRAPPYPVVWGAAPRDPPYPPGQWAPSFRGAAPRDPPYPPEWAPPSRVAAPPDPPVLNEIEPKLKQRVIRPPSAEYLAIDPYGDEKDTNVPATPWIWNPKTLENTWSADNPLKTTFSTNIIRVPPNESANVYTTSSDSTLVDRLDGLNINGTRETSQARPHPSMPSMYSTSTSTTGGQISEEPIEYLSPLPSVMPLETTSTTEYLAMSLRPNSLDLYGMDPMQVSLSFDKLLPHPYGDEKDTNVPATPWIWNPKTLENTWSADNSLKTTFSTNIIRVPPNESANVYTTSSDSTLVDRLDGLNINGTRETSQARPHPSMPSMYSTSTSTTGGQISEEPIEYLSPLPSATPLETTSTKRPLARGANPQISSSQPLSTITETPTYEEPAGYKSSSNSQDTSSRIRIYANIPPALQSGPSSQGSFHQPPYSRDDSSVSADRPFTRDRPSQSTLSTSTVTNLSNSFPNSSASCDIPSQETHIPPAFGQLPPHNSFSLEAIPQPVKIYDCPPLLDVQQSSSNLLDHRVPEDPKLLDIANTPSPNFQRNLIAAAQRLAEKSGLYPNCYELDNVTTSDTLEGSGSFADIYKGHFQGRAIVSREAILWGQLRHPNVLPFYGVYRYRSMVSFVAPWMVNGDIQSFLKRHQDSDRVVFAFDVAHGLQFLHKSCVVHGDLKGPNILIDEFKRACIADFGLSSVSDKEILAWTSHSMLSSKGGSVRWQAPELFNPEGEEDIINTYESDIYAWACVAYEIFAGQLPFAHLSRDPTVMNKVMAGERPTRPVELSPSWGVWGLNETIWAFMEACWSSNPAERPTMDAVIECLATSLPRDVSKKINDETLTPGQFREMTRDVDGTELSVEALERLISR
ncbi:hypothetical protein H0H92_010379 [Tricholoma furcatifolium]|nr:hypothetical protein H0H92_010379 [Tricholoma furcatifolium]